MIQLPRTCPPPAGPYRTAAYDAVLCDCRRVRCLKHATVIVTPVVEILPFLPGAARHAMWISSGNQIRSSDREGGRLNLRLADGSTAAISLRPADGLPAGTCWPMLSADRQHLQSRLWSGLKNWRLSGNGWRPWASVNRIWRESFVRSGRGGQKVNKTNNCVYLRHTPTGIAVKCHADRSRELNRFLARRELCDAVEQMQTGRCAARARVIQRMRKQKDRRRRRRSAPAPSPPDSE